jgi:hypothetical protein
LDKARCVIVVWTEGSTGPQGSFVRDEAGRGYQRKILVPVLIDRVAPPPGFGELQAIDLVAWKGRLKDPFYRDLLAAVRAKLAGQPVPPARGPALRLAQRMVYGSAGTVLKAGALA